MRILIYDHLLNAKGGAAKYECCLANMLKKKHEVTFISDFGINRSEYERILGYSLRGVTFRTPLVDEDDRNNFTKKIQRVIKANVDIRRLEDNQTIFEIIKSLRRYLNSGLRERIDDWISEISVNFDLFVNNIHTHTFTHVKPNADKNVIICHSINWSINPGNKKFCADRYDRIVCNSKYTQSVVKELWSLDSTLVYPPIDAYESDENKKRVILNTGIFGFERNQVGGISLFKGIMKENSDWKLMLVGTKMRESYLKKVLEGSKGLPVDVFYDPDARNLRKAYAISKIYWNLTGFGKKFSGVDHFGMATAEAMQNRCVPIAVNKAGPAEIITDGVDGFLVEDLDGVKSRTLELIRDDELRERMGENAAKRAADFSLEKFEKRVNEVVSSLEV